MNRTHAIGRTVGLGGLLATAMLLMSVGASAAADPAVTCDSLTKTALPQATVTAAKSVTVGGFDNSVQQHNFFYAYNLTGRAEQGTNPAFCQVTATLKPSADSDIKIEVWMPAQGWNGKFMGIGSFGWGGFINYDGLLSGLQAGYAVASTDTGHQDPDGRVGGSFSIGHPEKLIDYAYRADHEMTVAAKDIVKAFYGLTPTQSYWVGCSLGGLEGLIEAKRYPADYTGIISGAPPNPLIDFNAEQIWPSWLISKDPSSQISKDKLTVVHNAVIARCATAIGKANDVLDQPDKCDFDPKSLLCTGSDTPNCLTAPQVTLLQKEYQGPINPRTGKVIFPGPANGAEAAMYAEAQPMSVATDIFKSAAFEDANWDPMSMDWDKVLGKAEQKLNPLFLVEPGDLKPFFDGGGKLIFYIGWNDGHNPEQLMGFYDAVAKAVPNSPEAMRLFAIPGMNHCGGGEGCDTFNRLGAIDEWVTHNQAPDRILATKVVDGTIVRSRPICAYPNVSKYLGSGDVNDVTNFGCVAS